MFRAVGRWIKAIGYLLTGQIDNARKTLDANPHVIRATFDEIVREKKARIHQYKQAVAGLMAQQQGKVQKVDSLTTDLQKLGKLKAGALAMAKKVAQDLKSKGMTTEQIHQNEDYMKCLSAFNDFNSTVAEKQARIDELETDLDDYGTRIGEHKVQLQSLLRDMEKIKAEAADTIADVITAKEEKDLADTIAGIAVDGTAEKLQRMRQMRNEIKAEAHISKELAGTDTRAQEAEFLEYARTSDSSDEFDALIGLAETVEGVSTTETPQTERDTSLPE